MDFQAKFEAMSKQVDEIHHAVTGGKDPSKGLNVRVALLEQSEGRRRWMFRTAFAAACASLIDVAQRHIFR